MKIFNANKVQHYTNILRFFLKYKKQVSHSAQLLFFLYILVTMSLDTLCVPYMSLSLPLLLWYTKYHWLFELAWTHIYIYIDTNIKVLGQVGWNCFCNCSPKLIFTDVMLYRFFQHVWILLQVMANWRSNYIQVYSLSRNLVIDIVWLIFKSWPVSSKSA